MEKRWKKNKSVTIQSIIDRFSYEILSFGSGDGNINSTAIHTVGYEFAGFFQEAGIELDEHIQIVGKKEMEFLKTLSTKRKGLILNKYFSHKFPFCIVTADVMVDEMFLEVAKLKKKLVVKSPKKTSETIRELKFHLQSELAQECIIQNYVLLEIYGVGVLIGGFEDFKFGVTVELLERGHKFVTDNNIVVIRKSIDELFGYNRLRQNQIDAHFFLLNREGFKIDITNQFGIKGTRVSKRIDLIVELEKWNDGKFYDRLGLDTVTRGLLGVEIPVVTLPVKKGRNIAVIVETAAMNIRLKKLGINSAEYFWEESKKLIAENKRRRKIMGDNIIKELPVRELIKKFHLEVISGEELLDERFIRTQNLHRPSLALSGYYQMFEDEGYLGVQLFSEMEFKFLENFGEDEILSNLERYFQYKFPLIVVTSNVEVPEYFLELVKKYQVVICRIHHTTATQAIAVLNSYMEMYFSPATSIHGTFLELYGYGVLLIGKSGIGKSETALELIHRGHRLIADDVVKFIKGENNYIIGKADKLPYFMEIRGLGIIDIKALYGLGAVRINKTLDIVIELREQSSEEYTTSFNVDENKYTVLGDKIDKALLLISSGRNAAAMVEIAVMNLMAKKLGHDPERTYNLGMRRMTPEEREMIIPFSPDDEFRDLEEI